MKMARHLLFCALFVTWALAQGTELSCPARILSVNDYSPSQRQRFLSGFERAWNEYQQTRTLQTFRSHHERERQDFLAGVTFCSPESAENYYHLRIAKDADGIAYFQSARGTPTADRPFNTESAKAWRDDRLQRAIFVMTPEGEFYVSNYQVHGKFHHSSFLGNIPVAAAGEIEIDPAGRPIFVGNRSGHFPYGREMLIQVLVVLKAKGFPIEDIRIAEMVGESYGNPESYIPFPASIP